MPSQPMPFFARSTLLALAGIVLLAVALRVPTLSVQSLWFDESATRLVVDGSLRGVLDGVWDLEGSPPLFYLLTWAWVQVFGDGELALRSVSAIAGVALVPVMFLIGRRLAGERAGLLAALLAATSPLLVWFSQEARTYQLMALLVALAAHAALQVHGGRGTPAWLRFTLFAVLGVATHYFAAFIVVPLAVWLWRGEHRPAGAVRWALLALPAAGIALLPLALHQADRAKAATVGGFGTRLLQLPKQLAVGYYSVPDVVLGPAVGLIMLGALVLAVRRLDGEPRRWVLAALALVAAGIVPLLVLTAAGSDYLNTRNAIAVTVPLLAALAVALDRLPRGPLLAGAVALMGIATVVSVGISDRAQRDDWKGALEDIGPVGEARAIVTINQSVLPMEVYRPTATPMERDQVAGVIEIDVLGFAKRGTGEAPDAPDPKRFPTIPPTFKPTQTIETDLYTLQRFRAPTPQAMPWILLKGLDYFGRGSTRVFTESAGL